MFEHSDRLHDYALKLRDYIEIIMYSDLLNDTFDIFCIQIENEYLFINKYIKEDSIPFYKDMLEKGFKPYTKKSETDEFPSFVIAQF